MTDMTGQEKPARRDFIVIAAGAMVAGGGVMALWPLFAAMDPAGDRPPPDSVEVDLRPIRPGQMITVAWKGKPVLVRHRTAEEIASARGIDVAGLRDPLARNEAMAERTPASDVNRTVAGHQQWLVVIGMCTHMACRLIDPEVLRPREAATGYFCPCHAARFDHSGRVISGPATVNLTVPPYRFIGDDRIRIGAA